ncbi:RF-1 domain-containing protein [Aspergillus venezuelensis]
MLSMLRQSRLLSDITTKLTPSLRASTSIPHRTISASPSLAEKSLPPRLKLDDADITLSYLKGTGPGGQKINKTNSAVQLIHHPTGIVVKSQATRSRSQNEKYARQILADKVEEMLKGDQSRTAIKAERERKKAASKAKKSRRKYRALEAEKEKRKGDAGHDGEVGGREGDAVAGTGGKQEGG